MQYDIVYYKDKDLRFETQGLRYGGYRKSWLVGPGVVFGGLEKTEPRWKRPGRARHVRLDAVA